MKGRDNGRLVGAGSLPDEHQLCLRIADAEDDLPAPERVQLAPGAVADLRSRRGQRLRRAARHLKCA